MTSVRSSRRAHTYTIRKNWTLTTVFGKNDESGLAQGASTTADEVLVYNSATGVYATYYYKNTSLPPGSGTGWRSVNSSATDVSDSAYFKPSDGILIQRFASSPVAITLVGAVKLGTSDIPVNTGLNILGNVYPGGTFTLGTSGLYTGSATTGLVGGTTTSADTVLIYDPSSKAYSTYYYKTSTPPGSGTGWRSILSSATPVDTTPIPVGASILVQRQASAGVFEWVAPQPF